MCCLHVVLPKESRNYHRLSLLYPPGSTPDVTASVGSTKAKGRHALVGALHRLTGGGGPKIGEFNEFTTLWWIKQIKQKKKAFARVHSKFAEFRRRISNWSRKNCYSIGCNAYGQNDSKSLDEICMNLVPFGTKICPTFWQTFVSSTSAPWNGGWASNRSKRCWDRCQRPARKGLSTA